jgi:hypothetical protein
MTDDISGKKIGWLKAGILATSNGPARQMQAQDRLRASGFKIPKLDGGWA